ncbi:MAG: ribosome recycling factor [Chloroflexi bacterium RIFCSPLOWO2_12_FULL_71_12]|nr:MAG: ribosome recycling factor [Chloroflexi bacterium RIFCSPLOWO2_02_FULL_71_16]OGO74445.1 MAG: ribosome recycling factor [Chloroflexi bacterium RIFCSPLOWO2_12_FULL_71_12]
MPLEEILAQTEGRMKKAVEALRREVTSVRTGRASPALVESLEVDAYGSPMPLIQLAAITAPEPRLIVIQPWDRGLIKAIEKAIMASDLALTPQNDGQVVRLPIPALTEERRRDLVRVLHKKVEDGRVEIRTLRRHAHDEMRKKEKDAGIAADDFKRLEKRLQDLTDRYIALVDEVGDAKEKEILQV